MMSSTNLNTVVTPSGLQGLMPNRRVGRRTGMPSTVRRPFAPRALTDLTPPSPLGQTSLGVFSKMKPHLAMGGSVDFENVLGNSPSVPAAISSYSNAMRLAEGGQPEQDDLMKQVGNLLHRIHKVWHRNMCEGGMVREYAGGGQISRLAAKSHEKRSLDDAVHDLLDSMGIQEPADAAPYAAWKNWLMPTPASAALSLGLHSGEAGAADEWSMMPRDYMRQMRLNYRDRGAPIPRRYMEPTDAITNQMAPMDMTSGDLPRSLQNSVSGGQLPAWNMTR